MTPKSVRIIIRDLGEGEDGYAQYFDGSKVKMKRLNESKEALTRFFKKFSYVIISSEAAESLRVHGNIYTVKDFLPILFGKRR